MDAILSKVDSFLTSLEGPAFLFAIFLFIILVIGLIALNISGMVLISKRNVIRGVLRMIPAISFLVFVFLFTKDSWGAKEILEFDIIGLLFMSTLVQVGIMQVSKKETIPVIVGILLLLAAAALFIFVYIPIILEVIAFLKVLSGILVILFVVANIKIIHII